jgi:hypothetical protein
VVLSDEGGELTATGKRFLTGFGAALDTGAAKRRIFCRPCLDWSERRYHLAGLVGAEICRCCAERLARPQPPLPRHHYDARWPPRLARDVWYRARGADR